MCRKRTKNEPNLKQDSDGLEVRYINDDIGIYCENDLLTYKYYSSLVASYNGWLLCSQMTIILFF